MSDFRPSIGDWFTIALFTAAAGYAGFIVAYFVDGWLAWLVGFFSIPLGAAIGGAWAWYQCKRVRALRDRAEQNRTDRT